MKRVTLDTNHIVSEYLAGKSEYAIAREFDIARSVIRRHLLEANIIPRSHSDAGRVRARQMTIDERQRQAAAAHIASTGRVKTFSEKCLTARTRQERGVSISNSERQLAALLSDRGVESVPQVAIGPYNCDLGIDPVAVEIFGGHWHWAGDHLRRIPERFKYILNAGWHILVIHVTKEFHITPALADDVIAFIEFTRSDPTRRREYWVVRGTGEFITGGSLDDDRISIEPPFTIGRDQATGRYYRVPRDARAM